MQRQRVEFFTLAQVIEMVWTGAGYIGERTPKMCQGIWSPHLSLGEDAESSSKTLYQTRNNSLNHYHYHYEIWSRFSLEFP